MGKQQIYYQQNIKRRWSIYDEFDITDFILFGTSFSRNLYMV